ncbi:MAG: tetratricopeptide repeat protein [Candidatus Aureabacteria bacterium]|nr:tetratricopeptide repeat protein [Candidatus Auribacterota bacterium]
MKQAAYFIFLFLFFIVPEAGRSLELDFSDGSPEGLTTKARGALEAKEYEAALAYADKCITSFFQKAVEQQSSLSDFAPQDEASSYWALNAVGICYFIKGKAYRGMNDNKKAISSFQQVIELFPHAQCWDDAGEYFWKVADAAKDQILGIHKGVDFGDYKSETLTGRAWKSYLLKKYDQAIIYADKCLEIYMDQALEQQGSLKAFASKQKVFDYWALNDVATSAFIKAKTLFIQNKKDEALKIFRMIVRDLTYAQCWNPDGYFWKVADAAQDEIIKIEKNVDFGNYSSLDLTTKAWAALEKKEYDIVDIYTKKCIELYEKEAREQESRLEDFPKDEEASLYWALNDVAACYFIRAKALALQKKTAEATSTYRKIIKTFPHAQCYDMNGWFWKVAKASEDEILIQEKGISFGDYKSSTLTGKAWEAFEKRSYDICLIYIKKCIELYEKEACRQQSSLNSYPQGEAAHQYWALNDVAVCYFIMGQVYAKQKKWREAKDAFNKVIEDLYFAQSWDTAGFFWKVSVAARKELSRISSKR